MSAEQNGKGLFTSLEDELNRTGDPDLARKVVAIQREYTKRHDAVDIFDSQQARLIREAKSAWKEASTRYRAIWDNYEDKEVARLLTPELVDHTWQTYWHAKTTQISLGRELDTPHCDRTNAELIELRKQNRGIVLLPDEIMEAKNALLMARLYPNKNRTWTFRDTHQGGGSVDIEMDIEPPHQNTARQGVGVLSVIAAVPSLQGQRVRTYVIGSDFSYHMTGQYFTSTPEVPCTLPGTYLGSSRIVNVNSQAPGEYRFSTGHYRWSGYRTEGSRAA